jgi:dTMP kinase
MGLFVTFEGPEGSGKSTQARRLYEHLTAAGYLVLLTREPGGTRIGDGIRSLLLDLANTEMAPTTETLLFSAARAQHVTERIRPHLERGGIVVCDRFADSTYAYQGYGLGRDLDELKVITRIATGGLTPDLTILLDLPVEVGLGRKRFGEAPGTVQDAAEWNRLDAREISFHQRVRAGYHELCKVDTERWLMFDAQRDRDDLTASIQKAVQHRLSISSYREGQPNHETDDRGHPAPGRSQSGQGA